MRTRFTSLIAAIIFSATVNFSFAQSFVSQVIVLNEGPFGGPVIVGTYNPTTQVYTDFDTINARFASDVIIDGNFIYVAADSVLAKYNKTTYALVNSIIVPGIRELAVWNNLLLVTRAEVNPLPSYFQVYDKNTFGFVYELPAVSERCSEVKVLNDTAYAAVNGWGSVGKLAVIDLNGQALNREIDLGPDGLNPEAVRVEGNLIYTVNSLNWTNSSVTVYDGITTSFTNDLLGTAGNCSASALRNGNVYFQVFAENKLGVYDAVSSTVWDTLYINSTIYGMGIDTLNNLIYTGMTDFTTTGSVMVYDMAGSMVDSFAVHVSPGTFAIDVQAITATSATAGIDATSLSVYPNPSSGSFSVQSSMLYGSVNVTDITGRIIFTSSIEGGKLDLDLHGRSAGVYFVELKGEQGVVTKKIVKQ